MVLVERFYRNNKQLEQLRSLENFNVFKPPGN